MDATLKKIAFGGGCHWCTEAIFQKIVGVVKVEQGYVASKANHFDYSEGVIVHYDRDKISLESLIEIHLHTHQSTSNHSMRNKYRSAIYYFDENDKIEALETLKNLKPDFEKEIITKVLPFISFKSSREEIQNYYLKGPDKPFCQNFISPKLELLKKKFYTSLK
ncbi:peptide-methionine (S)-S-oxide reductase [Salegentibacter salarius]|uniref:peptide-methionine (S)-S-oxide reductase n=1 Tax=Salegentibacter salarius TaxID=435906 RepID=A0A2N0TMS8_9FLAO|nr:peptide-methionine (S)-S-oxide reductase [Salegentibacter salarius]OEY71395.1 peptide methionine sulfoxide reductase [Salegentibacter salarius]PKD16032.1 peptide methionine sulfoxide reductase [Salegentibacter salarius]SLJ91877.1 peptide-methionine (S)-S-oxide reductase [Salegentibacter salarius]